MDARELTPIVQKNKDDVYQLKKDVELLKQELAKQRLLIDDMRIDVQMLEKRR